ncbi:Crp/Fnr family transcriptional regulator [Streptoalloteichus tenebrarius]|uniref:Crp/Fnr family transcriptional regulator n=1 Tax=Streptoalloteichus tenebrarius (strain ATCC 17920 / DSM 40477 / JCM 4838 / CBS 697.72 / NBRC 16177 / NCIMB 11028 / NRRL B-12390 / A12253. 1 / ISP 5477) TaxID=1933 RepID=UPI0020A45D56|nr:Crp/Fnr family transcriptional regulator [Streptoalloteichus tenebrarius]
MPSETAGAKFRRVRLAVDPVVAALGLGAGSGRAGSWFTCWGESGMAMGATEPVGGPGRGRVSRELADELRRVGTPLRHRPGQVVMRQGDLGTHVLLVETGRFTVVRVGADGGRRLLTIRGPGHLVGETAVLDGGPRTASVIAIDSCVTFLVQGGPFRRLLRRGELAEAVDRYVLDTARARDGLAAELAGLPARERVARILLRLHQAADPPAGVAATVPLTQVELAHALGVARGSLTAALARLRRQGVVATVGGRLVVVDPGRLAVAAGVGGSDRAIG